MMRVACRGIQFDALNAGDSVVHLGYDQRTAVAQPFDEGALVRYREGAGQRGVLPFPDDAVGLRRDRLCVVGVALPIRDSVREGLAILDYQRAVITPVGYRFANGGRKLTIIKATCNTPKAASANARRTMPAVDLARKLDEWPSPQDTLMTTVNIISATVKFPVKNIGTPAVYSQISTTMNSHHTNIGVAINGPQARRLVTAANATRAGTI